MTVLTWLIMGVGTLIAIAIILVVMVHNDPDIWG
jgi:hypothetical protein